MKASHLERDLLDYISHWWGERHEIFICLYSEHV